MPVRQMMGLLVVSLCLLAPASAIADDFEAFTRARHALQLGVTVPGQVHQIPVKAGQQVKAGDLLLELEDLEGEAQIEILQMQAASNVEVEAADAALEMARYELRKVEGMYADKIGGSLVEVERAKIQVRIAELKLEQAKLDHSLLEVQVKQAVARHARYKLTAPMDGTVEEVAISVGETVEQLKPVIALVVTDPLWIDTAVTTSKTLELNVGDKTWITIGLPGFEGKPIIGKIIFIGQVVDAASDTRVVRVEMPNAARLPAGVQVKVSFSPPSEIASNR